MSWKRSVAGDLKAQRAQVLLNLEMLFGSGERGACTIYP